MRTNLPGERRQHVARGLHVQHCAHECTGGMDDLTRMR
jgi:hypothetical protein